MSRSIRVGVAALMAGAVTALAACGGSSSPGVASLTGSGHGTTTTVSKETLSQLWHAAAECMRQHGVDMPDPVIGTGGAIRIQIGGPASDKAAVVSANAACQSKLDAASNAAPGAKRPSPADAAKLVKFSQCMRAHGVPDFPDPSSSGGIRISTGGSPGSPSGPTGDLNPSNPAFQKAQSTCQKLLPGGGAKLSTQSGSSGNVAGATAGTP